MVATVVDGSRPSGQARRDFMFNMVRKLNTREDLGDIESWLVGQSLRFAAEITERFKEVPKILAATEALSFFLHALRREAFRSTAWKTWEAIVEPSQKQMLHLFALTLSGWADADIERNSLVKDVQNLVSTRSLEYQTLPFLNGNATDRQTVVWVASRRIAEAAAAEQRPAVIDTVHAILGRAVDRELPQQVEKLEKILYGSSAKAA
jgi:hypothetical protein